MCVVKIVKLDANAQIPNYQTSGSSGCDLCSCENIVLKARTTMLVHTGIAVELPDGYEAQVRSRSGLALKHGISVLNSPGTVDRDFTGEVGVILTNPTSKDFEIKIGDRIAQLVFARVSKAHFTEVTELSKTDRGSGGFGSTGK